MECHILNKFPKFINIHVFALSARLRAVPQKNISRSFDNDLEIFQSITNKNKEHLPIPRSFTKKSKGNLY